MAELPTLTAIEEPQSETITVTEEPYSHVSRLYSMIHLISFNIQEEQLVLHLHKPKSEKKVQWGEEVIDNEFLGKKSSKCKLLLVSEEKDWMYLLVHSIMMFPFVLDVVYMKCVSLSSLLWYNQ